MQDHEIESHKKPASKADMEKIIRQLEMHVSTIEESLKRIEAKLNVFMKKKKNLTKKQ